MIPKWVAKTKKNHRGCAAVFSLASTRSSKLGSLSLMFLQKLKDWDYLRWSQSGWLKPRKNHRGSAAIFSLAPTSSSKLVSLSLMKKPAVSRRFFLVCGERGIRTPGPLTVNGFQDRRNRPLCHLSAAKVILRILETKNLWIIYPFYSFLTVYFFVFQGQNW